MIDAILAVIQLALFLTLKIYNMRYIKGFIITICIVGVLGYTSFFLLQRGKKRHDGYNVILISLDTLRADHLSCYDYTRKTTPTIDKLAENAFLFTDAYANASYTLASHMSIFSSLYPSGHKLVYPFEKNVLDEKYKTLIQLFKEDDYTTAWCGILNDRHLDLTRGFERGFDHFCDSWELKKNDVEVWNKGFRWIKRNKNKKFFIFFHTYWIHDPYLPHRKEDNHFAPLVNQYLDLTRREFYDMMVNKISCNPTSVMTDDAVKKYKRLFLNTSLFNKVMAWFFVRGFLKGPQIHTTYYTSFHNEYWKRFSLNPVLEDIFALYDTGIFETDQDIERLITLLKKNNLLQKTIIVITSDHGEEMYEHGLIGVHGDTLYDEVTHVPLIIWVPGIDGQKSNALVQSIDIAPTILELVGMKSGQYMQGKSLVPIMRGEKDHVNRFVFGETYNDLKALRTKKWKYITNFSSIEELFDLENDPQEKHNLYDTRNDITKEMKQKMDEVLLRITGYPIRTE